MRTMLRTASAVGLAILFLSPFVGGCAFNCPSEVTEGWRESAGTTEARAKTQTQDGASQSDLDDLRNRIADLERRLAANEQLAEDAMNEAEKALKCCRHEYTVLSTEEVYFDFNKYDIKSEYYDDLDRVGEKLKADPDLICEIGGHCDAIGGTDYNIVLGQKRADAARQYLISKHQINLGRIAIRTFGKDAPIATNDSDQGRSKNRRVTIDVLGFAP